MTTEITDEEIRAWVEESTVLAAPEQLMTIEHPDRWPGEVEQAEAGVFFREVRELAVETIRQGAWCGRRLDWPVLARVVSGKRVWGRAVLLETLAIVQRVVADELPVAVHEGVFDSAGFVVRRGRLHGMLGEVDDA